MPFEAWLGQQSPRMGTMIRTVLDRGLTDWDFQVPEPSIRVVHHGSPSWPDSFSDGAVTLPISMIADFIDRPLRLLLENGRNDFGFLGKIVPRTWREDWRNAVERGWILSQGAGLTELTQVIRTQIALDHAYRLRTWVMFDSDGRVSGHLTTSARKALDTCKEWKMAHHVLERRAIENYIPKAQLFDLAARRAVDEKIQIDYIRFIHACVEAYFAMENEQRHYYNLADGFKADANSQEKLDDPTKTRLAKLYEASLRAPSSPLYMHEAHMFL